MGLLDLIKYYHLELQHQNKVRRCNAASSCGPRYCIRVLSDLGGPPTTAWGGPFLPIRTLGPLQGPGGRQSPGCHGAAQRTFSSGSKDPLKAGRYERALSLRKTQRDCMASGPSSACGCCSCRYPRRRSLEVAAGLMEVAALLV